MLKKDDRFVHIAGLFYLVQSDKVIKSYNGSVDVPFEAIVEDVKVLSEEQ